MRTLFKTTVDDITSSGEETFGTNVNIDKIEIHWGCTFKINDNGFTYIVDVSNCYIKGFRDDDDGTPQPFEIMWSPSDWTVVQGDECEVTINSIDVDFGEDTMILKL